MNRPARVCRVFAALAVAAVVGFGPATAAFADSSAGHPEVAARQAPVAAQNIAAPPLVFATGQILTRGGGSGGGGHSGGSSGGSHSVGRSSGGSGVGHGSSGGSGVGRGVTAPRNSGGKAPATSGKVNTGTKTNTGTGTGTGKTNTGTGHTNSGTGTGRNVTKPNNSGAKVPVTSGKVTVAKNTRVTSGARSYKVNGHTYSYSRTTYRNYYTSYRGYGGYPSCRCGSTYFLLLNDPYYWPNYAYVGSPWYGHPYPVGYVVDRTNGEFVPDAHYHPGPSAGTVFLWILVILVIIAAAGGGLYLFTHRRRRLDF
jgi:hypothetical protein